MALTTVEQGLSFVQYEADGTIGNFPVTFQYLGQSDIKVFVGNTEVSYTWLNAATVTPNTLPSDGDIVTVRRFTTNTERLVDYQDGGQISERDLDKDSDQLFFLTQEAADTTNFNLTTDPLLQVVDFRGNRGINLADPQEPTDAINRRYTDEIAEDVADAVATANSASITANQAADDANAISQVAFDAEAKVDAHILDVEAHLASSIVNTPSGTITSTTVQGALNQLDSLKQSRSEKGQPEGYAGLDGNGKVPAGQLPSFVEDVLEFADFASFPVTGETGKLYVAIDTSKVFRWSGTVYTEISPSQVDSVNGYTGAVTLDKTDIGLDQVDNTSDATKNAAEATLTNKSLVSPNRLDPKKDTLDNLLTYAATAQNGELVYSTDTQEFFVISDGDLVEAGGGDDPANLFPDPQFNRDSDQGTCTGCTFQDFSTVLASDVFIGKHALGIQFLNFDGQAVFDFPVRESQRGLQGMLDLRLKVKQGGDYKLDITREGNVVDTLDITSQDGYIRYSYYFVLGTSVGFNIRNTESVVTGDTVYIDDVFIGTKSVGTAPFKNCSDGLDCVNEFSAFYDSAETDLTIAVKEQTPSTWITNTAKSEGGNFRKTFTVPNGVFSQTPKCVTGSSLQNRGADYIKNLSSETSLVFDTLIKSSATGTDESFSFACFKHPDDYKPITEQGVLTKEGSAGARLIVSKEPSTADIAVGASTITVPFDVTNFSRLIEWDSVNHEATFLKGGLYNVSSHYVAINASTSDQHQAFVEVDRGSGFESPLDDSVFCSVFSGNTIIQLPPISCDFSVKVNKGDKLRLRARAFNSSSAIYNRANVGLKMIIQPQPDTESIHAEIQSMVRYEGESSLTAGYASFGGASDESVCNTSPCTRYREIGEVGKNMSVTRTGTGDYTLEVTGFKHNTPITCSLNADNGVGGVRIPMLASSGLMSDASGAASIALVTFTAGSNPSFADGYLHIKCEGLKP